MEIKQIAHANGAIRNVNGQLIAFYDAEAKLLHINGRPAALRANDIAEAMELVGEHA